MCTYDCVFGVKCALVLPTAKSFNSCTVLQVVTNRETQETLLCVACVFEVSNSEHGAQHHIYRLVKDWSSSTHTSNTTSRQSETHREQWRLFTEAFRLHSWRPPTDWEQPLNDSRPRFTWLCLCQFTRRLLSRFGWGLEWMITFICVSLVFWCLVFINLSCGWNGTVLLLCSDVCLTWLMF